MGERLTHSERATESEILIQRRRPLGYIFDSNTSDEGRKKAVIEMAELFLKSEAIDGNAIRHAIEEFSSDESKEKFVEGMHAIIQPIYDLAKNNPVEFEKIARERGRAMADIALNEVLYCDIEGEEAKLHLGPARTLGPIALRRKILEGFKQLAVVIENNKEIAIISGTSWIFHENPGLAEKLGFTLQEETSDDPSEEKSRKATMLREDFLKKYLEK